MEVEALSAINPNNSVNARVAGVSPSDFYAPRAAGERTDASELGPPFQAEGWGTSRFDLAGRIHLHLFRGRIRPNAPPCLRCFSLQEQGAVAGRSRGKRGTL